MQSQYQYGTSVKTYNTYNNNLYNNNNYNKEGSDSESKEEKKHDKLVLGLFIVRMVISALFLTLNFIWLYRVKDSAKKEEPNIEKRQSLISERNINYRSLAFSEEKCEEILPNFLEKGAYETFNFKINKIYKYSKILIIILYIQVGINGLNIIILFLTNVAIIYTSFDLLVSLINTIIFIILSVFYNKGEYEDFEDFKNCYFFDKTEFGKNYDNIFIIHKNYKKALIFNIIFIFFNCFMNVCLCCIGGK